MENTVSLESFAEQTKSTFVPWVATINELDEVLNGYTSGIPVTVIHKWLTSMYGSAVPSINRLRDTIKQVRDERA